MRTSSRTQPARTGSKTSRNACADANACTGRRTVSISQHRLRTTAWSSSTMKTVGFGFNACSLLPRRRQREAEPCAAPGARIDRDAAAVGLDDRAADRQPDADAVALGREERVEDPIEHRRVEPGSGVGHLDLDAPVTRRGAYGDLAPRRTRLAHRVERVAHQVADDLLDHDRIGQ